MSFLAPWFVVAGVAAVSLPILFHFFRRTPRDRFRFSTLMFLAPSPPRVTSRSRLENLPLLLLRALVLVLLAMAFGRPLWRQLLESQSDVPIGTRTVILIDTSASMQRGDLAKRAVREAETLAAAAGPHDEVAVMTFDSTVRRPVTFESWRSAPAGERAGLARAALLDLKPSWSATRLDAALTSAAEELDAADDKRRDAAASKDGAPAPEAPSSTRRANRIVLLSDLQTGSRTTGLQGYEWPKHIELSVVPLAVATTNAGVHPLELAAEAEQAEKAAKSPRVLVTNAADSKLESFELAWQPAKGAASSTEPAATVKTYIPPGQTRVVRSPALPAGEALQLVLKGDDESFDNRLWFVPPKRERIRVLHFADEKSEDPQSLRYFLERAFADAGSERIVKVETIDPSAAPARAPTERDLDDVALVTIAGGKPLAEAWQRTLGPWLDRGGVVAAVALGSGDEPWRTLLPDALAKEKALTVADADRTREYALLGEIDFKHPLFAPLADPRFSDFTKIRFWRHRKLTFDADAAKLVRILARYDDRAPAVVEIARGSGRVVLFASGWQPRESQLGVSSKFIPLTTMLVELGRRRPTIAASFETGAVVDLVQLTSVVDVPGAKPAASATATPSATPIPSATVAKSQVSPTATASATPSATADGKLKPAAGPWVVRAPDGTETNVKSDAPRYELAAGPGVYEVRSTAGLVRVAANVAADESKTAPLGLEALESFGVRVVKDVPQKPTEETVAERQTLQVNEMEAKQRLWRWCLALALVAITVETWYAGRVARREAVA